MPMPCANLDRAPAVFGLPGATAPHRPSGIQRAVLLALRDWMTAAEVVDVARQLPEGWVPVIFEGWRPQSVARANPTRFEFAASVVRYLGGKHVTIREVEIADALRDLVPMLPDRLFVRKPPCDRTTRTGTFH